jgi:hypothetical protein
MRVWVRRRRRERERERERERKRDRERCSGKNSTHNTGTQSVRIKTLRGQVHAMPERFKKNKRLTTDVAVKERGAYDAKVFAGLRALHDNVCYLVRDLFQRLLLRCHFLYRHTLVRD